MGLSTNSSVSHRLGDEGPLAGHAWPASWESVVDNKRVERIQTHKAGQTWPALMIFPTPGNVERPGGEGSFVSAGLILLPGGAKTGGRGGAISLVSGLARKR